MASFEWPDRAVATRIRRSAMLAAGDALAFIVFAAVGRASHSEAAGLAAILQVAETAAPFAIGWYMVAPFAGAYGAEITGQPRRMLARSALAWLLAWPIGLLLRALIRQSPIPISFAIVTLITNMLLLLSWRGVFAWLISKGKR
jgi:DUF3054 family protein